MKKICFAAALLLGTATAASAQSNAVKANIFSPLVKTGSFFYERQLGEHRSAQLGGLFTSWGTNGTSISGFALTPEYRFYLSEKKTGLEGFYLGPYVRYQNLTLKNETEIAYPDEDGNLSSMSGKAALNTLGGGVVAGYQLQFKKRFTLDTFLGPSYNGGQIKVTAGGDNQTFSTDAFTGFGIRTGVTFGVAF